MAKRKAFNFSVADKIIASGGEGQNVKEESTEVQSAEVTQQDSLVKNAMERMEKPADTRSFNLKFIPREKIVFHKNNNFPMEKIESTANSILEFGLIHNLEVLYDEDQDIYILESGERRTRAIDLLIKRFGNYSGDPENVDYKNYLKIYFALFVLH